MFWLKKTLTYCLMPLPVVLALLVGGFILAGSDKHRRLGRFLSFAGILVLLITSHRQVGLNLLAPLENQYSAIPELTENTPIPADLAACHYIVVLGGGHADMLGLPASSKLSPYALSRLTEAVRLARALPMAKLITLGPGRPGQDTHAHVLATAAISLGIDSNRIIENSLGRDTEGEALALREIVGGAPFALVTSAWHMPRSMGLMRKAGLNPLACPTDYQARANQTFSLNDWLWGIDGLERSSWAIYERLGTFWAKLRGKI
jgi:uncharacterized SAM-binding protein YcdF (DUF218 family)